MEGINGLTSGPKNSVTLSLTQMSRTVSNDEAKKILALFEKYLKS